MRKELTRLLLGSIFYFPVSGVLDRPAWSQTNPDCTAGTVVLYINGIRTTRDGAFNDFLYLRAVVNTFRTPDGKPVQYDYIHNPNDGNLNDLRETLIQWIDQNPVRRFLRSFADQIIAALFNQLQNSFISNIPGIGSIVTDLTQFLRVAAAPYVAASNRVATISSTVRDKIITYVQQGNRVIVVSHSQGNFVANTAIESLPNNYQQAVRLVSVATPANHVAGGGPYATLGLDIINNVPGSLPSNVSQFFPCLGDPILNHSFTECYLTQSDTARSRITNGVTDGFSIALPQQIIGLGVITATLSWGSQPDVDLHVFEPNGAHVYYANRVGPSGTLDRDDTDGAGPENYAVCERPVEVGQYRVGVNYFRGSAPEVARVEVKAGSHSRGMSIPLPSERGPAGDSSPVPVVTVTVSRGTNNVLQYQIQ